MRRIRIDLFGASIRTLLLLARREEKDHLTLRSVAQAVAGFVAEPEVAARMSELGGSPLKLCIELAGSADHLVCRPPPVSTGRNGA